MAAEPRVGPARVAYLVSQYPKVSHAFVEREIRALRAAGAEVHTFSVRPVPDSEVLTPADRAERDRTPALLDDGRAALAALVLLVATHPMVAARGLVRALRSGPRTPRNALWQLFYLAEAALLVCWMRERRLRHVHVHFANNGADVGRLAALLGSELHREPWTWSLAMHGPTELDDVTGSDLAAKVRSASFVACISEYCRQRLSRLVGPEHQAKLRLVRMAPETTRYPRMPRPREAGAPTRVLFVGRLVPEKDPLLLLDAIAAELHDHRGVVVRVVGDGALRGVLEERVAALGLQDVIDLVGAVGQDELPAHYAWADVFCLPSHAEGLPVVLMEAMATGLPVVTTPVAGIPELVDDGVTGLLVPPGRAEALAEALHRLADPALRDRLGTRAADAVRAKHDGGHEAAALLALLP